MTDQKHLVRTRDDLPCGHWLARQLPAGASLRSYAEERAIINLTRQVQMALDAAGLSRAEVAQLLGTSRSFVSQVLNGSANMTLKTLGALMWAAGRQVDGIQSERLGTLTPKPTETRVLRFSVPFSTEEKPEGTGAAIRMAK